MTAYTPSSHALDKLGRGRDFVLEARAGFGKDTEGFRRCNYVLEAIDVAMVAFEISHRLDLIQAKETELGDLRNELGELQRLRDGGAK